MVLQLSTWQAMSHLYPNGETQTKRFLRNTKFRFLFTRHKPSKNPGWVRPKRSSQDRKDEI